MRSSILCLTAALIAAGCSHSKEEGTTTEEVKQQQPPAAEAETQGGSTASTGGDQSCPMQVPGTTLRTEDTSGGVALVFLSSDSVPEVRSRVRQLASMHNRMQKGGSRSGTQGGSSKAPPTSNSIPGSGMYDTQGSGAPGGGTLGGSEQNTYGGGSMAMQPSPGEGSTMMMPSSTARAEDIDGGAQLILIATDPSQTDALRQNAREQAQNMAAGDCSMMTGMTTGTMPQNGMQQQDMQMQHDMQNTMPPNGMQNEPSGY